MKSIKIKLTTVLRCIYNLICCFCAFYFCQKLLILYFQYSVASKGLPVSKTDLSFPGITICSSIAIRKSMLLKLSGDELLVNATPSVELQLTLDKYYHKYLQDNPVDELIKDTMNFDDVVAPENVVCLADEIRKTNHCNYLQENSLASCENLKSCFTLFHKSQANKLLDDKKLLPTKINTHKRKKFDTNSILASEEMAPLMKSEIIKMLVSMNKNESTSLHLPVTGDIRIHGNTRGPNYADTAIEFQSGQYMHIEISIYTFRLLPPPYETKCADYYEGPVKDSNPLFGRIRSSFDCTSSCLVKITINKCKCWPPEIPYYADRHGNATANIVLCNWMEMAKATFKQPINVSSSDFVQQQSALIKKASDIFTDCTGSWLPACEKKCPLSCKFSIFNINSETTTWPSDQAVENSPEARELRDSYALISLSHTRYYRLLIYTPNYDFKTTLSSILGVFNLWLTFTVLNVLYYIEIVCKYTWKKIISIQ